MTTSWQSIYLLQNGVRKSTDGVLRASQADLNKADLYLLRPQERQPMIHVVCFALLKQTKQNKKKFLQMTGVNRQEGVSLVCVQ